MTPLRRLRRAAIDVEPLRHATFRRLWAGNSLGFVGFQLTAVAVPVQVYEVTGSSFWVGMLGLVGLVPLVLFGLWGGAVADAVDRRVLLLLGSSLLLWGCTGGLLGAALAGVASLPLLLGLVAVQAAGFAVASSTPGGDRAPGAARGAGAVGQHPVVHRLQRRPGARPPWCASGKRRSLACRNPLTPTTYRNGTSGTQH